MPANVTTAKELFLAAADMPHSERTAYLDEACAGNTGLRRRVEDLLRAHDGADSVLDKPVVEQGAERNTTQAEGSTGASQPHSDPNPTEGNGSARGDDDHLAYLAPAGKPGCLGQLGPYEVQKILGRGGFGVVLKAFDERLHRVVAIKVLSPAYASNGAARKRFIREARAAAAVKNEHVVGIHDVQGDADPPYLVMEYIDGISLQDKIDTQGSFDIKETLRIGLQIAEGLAAAHKQGLVHRDIKPANILLENGVERVKITDFGLARAVDDASVTQSGTVAGTPMYMSPEQAEGLPINHRSDLFSLGTVLYAMCTGHPPFRASGTHAVLKRVIDAAPRPIHEINNEVPEWLCDIIAKLHAKKPEDRFPTAKEVAELLGQRLADVQAGRAIEERVAGAEVLRSLGEPAKDIVVATEASKIQPRPPDESVKASPSPRRWRRRLVAASAAIGLVVLGIVLWNRPPRLSLQDCNGIVVNSPYSAWCLVLQRDGSAKLVGGHGQSIDGLGFSPILTGRILADSPHCTFPEGTFQFAALFAELRRQSKANLGQHGLDYPEMPYRVDFMAASPVIIESSGKNRSRYADDELQRFLTPADGLRLLEAVRQKAIEHKLWHEHLEASWPYPPIPWNADRPVPANLRTRKQGAQVKRNALRGKWLIESGEANGEPLPKEFLDAVRIAFDDKFELKIADFHESRIDFALDGAASPKTITARLPGQSSSGGGADKVNVLASQLVPRYQLAGNLRGIYELDGNKLKLCIAQSGYAAPKRFDSRTDDGALYGALNLVLVRAPDERIQGKWDLVEAEFNSGKVNVAGWMEFTGATGKSSLSGLVSEWGFKLNPSAQPKQIDFTNPDGTLLAQSIYDLQGDTLIIAQGTIRPDSFNSQGRTVYRYRRVSEPGWVQLFNGKDIKGWTTSDKHPGVWTVDPKTGILTGKILDQKTSFRTFLVSDYKDLTNFHARVEMKINTESAGLIFHGKGPDYTTNEAYLNFMEGEGKTLGLIVRSKDGVRTTFTSPVAADKYRDKWIMLEVIAQGTVITYRIDGEFIAQIRDAKFEPGRLALEVAMPGALLEVKKVEVKELPGDVGLAS